VEYVTDITDWEEPVQNALRGRNPAKIESADIASIIGTGSDAALSYIF
jgi:hypothetical protein